MTDRRIRIILDKTQAEKGAKDLDRSITGIGKSADKSQFSINKLAGAIAAVISTQKIIAYADAWTNVQNQLRQTVNSQEQLADTSDRILAIARETRGDLGATAGLYSNLRLSIDENVVSSERLFGVIETVNKGLALSGTESAAAAGAIRQLTQGLSAGALRGDEFNSVAEQAPIIMRALSKETGMAVGELRAFAAEGNITTELLITAIENYSSVVDEKFAETAPTMQQAMQVARTNAIALVGGLNDATGASEHLARAIIDLSESASSDLLGYLLDTLHTARLTLDATSASAADLGNEMQLLADTGTNALDLLGTAFRDLLPNIRAVIQLLGNGLASGIEAFKADASGIAGVVKAAFGDGTVEEAVQNWKNQRQLLNEVYEDGVSIILNERAEILKTAQVASEARRNEAKERAELRAQREADLQAEIASRQLAPSPQRQQMDEFDSVGEDPFDKTAFDRQAEALAMGTQQLQRELENRRMISQLYRDADIEAMQNQFAQQRELAAIAEQERLLLEEEKYLTDQEMRVARFEEMLERETLEAEQVAELRRLFEEQEAARLAAFEEQKTAIAEEGATARAKIDRDEKMARIGTWESMANSGLQILGAFASNSFKATKILGIAESGVSIVSGVAKALNNPYPANLGFAAQVAAQGAALIGKLKSTNLGGGGGSPQISASAPPQPQQTQAPPENLRPQEQNRAVVDLRGVSEDQWYKGDKIVGLVKELNKYMGDGNAVIRTEDR